MVLNGWWCVGQLLNHVLDSAHLGHHDQEPLDLVNLQAAACEKRYRERESAAVLEGNKYTQLASSQLASSQLASSQLASSQLASSQLASSQLAFK